MVWPSCHQNSRERRKGRVVFSQRTTEHHWLYSMGSWRQEWSTWAQWSQNMVSEVGRMARRSSKGSEPPAVTQATSGAKPLTSSPSFWSRLSGISRGMATFSWPVFLNMPSMMSTMFSQMA